MTAPYEQAFQAGAQAGTNLSKGIGRGFEMSGIDQILSQVSQSNDPQEINNAMGQILANVSPENREGATQFLQTKLKNIAQTRKDQQKFVNNLEKNITNSLKFQNIGPESVTQENKEKIKQAALNAYLSTGDENAASDVVSQFAQEIAADQQAQEAATVPFGERGPAFGRTEEQQAQKPGMPAPGTGPNIADIGEQLKSYLTVPEPKEPIKEVFGQSLDKISKLPLPDIIKDFITKNAEKLKEQENASKSALSGLTFGLSENIPGMKPEEPRSVAGKITNTFAKIGGSLFTGAALEKYGFQLAGNAVGKAVASKSGSLLKGLASQIATKSALRGTSSAGVKFLNEFIKNEEPINYKDIIKHGAVVAGIGAGFDILGDAVLPLKRSLDNMAARAGTSKWDMYKRYAEAVKNKGFSFFKGGSPGETVTPNRIKEIGEEFVSVKSLPNLVQENISSKAKDFKAAAEDVALGARSVAAKSGLDMAAVEAGQPEAVSQFNNIVTQLKETDLPVQKVAARAEKVAPPRIIDEKKEAEVFKEQVKNYPKYATEIQIDQAKRDKIKNRIKRAATLEKESLRKEAARKEIEPIRKTVQEQSARIRALEDAEFEAKGKEKERIKSLLDYEKQDLVNSEDLFERALKISYTGDERGTIKDLQKAAEKRLDTLSEEAARLKKPITLSKSDYNPERTKMANELLKKKQPPGKPRDDFHQKVMRTYKDTYERRLKEIGDEIKQARDSRVIESLFALRREEEALKKLIKRTDTERYLHERNQKLREIKARKEVAERLKASEIKRDGELTKLFKNYTAKPTRETGKKIAEELDVNYDKLEKDVEKTVKEITEEDLTNEKIKKKLEDLEKKIDQNQKQQSKAKEEPKAKESIKEKLKKEKNKKRLKDLLYGLLRVAFKSWTGLALPVSTSASALIIKAPAIFRYAQKKFRVKKFKTLKGNQSGIIKYSQELERNGMSKAAVRKIRREAGLT